MAATVAIVGRANVGKSTLFNRMVRKNRALVHDRPGITRDRIKAPCDINGTNFWLVDTGGLELDKDHQSLEKVIQTQAQYAIEEADLVLFVMDARAGVTAQEKEIFAWLRKAGKNILPILNKVDPGFKATVELDVFSLGISDFIRISSAHGLGFDHLYERIVSEIEKLPKEEFVRDANIRKKDVTKVAFVGRPNVGKSSLINFLLGEDRMAVSEVAGTTRDSIDTVLSYEDTHYLLVDTAGVRKQRQIIDEVEKFSIQRTFDAIDRSDVTVLVLDALEGFTTQDAKIASRIVSSGVGCIVAMNKWDLVADSRKMREETRKDFYAFAPFLSFAAIRYVSALTGDGVVGILPSARRIHGNHMRRFTRDELKEVFEKVIQTCPPRGVGTQFLYLYELQQNQKFGSRFILVCNQKKLIQDSYLRMWENAITRILSYEGVPIEVRPKEKLSKRKKSVSSSRPRKSR